jgi:hypothetical protein
MKEDINLDQQPRFAWKVERSSKYGTYIYLHDKSERSSIGEFSFQIRKEYKDPMNPGLEEEPRTIAYIGMWQVNDAARGNLAVIRNMFKAAIPEFKKYDAEYMVGHYVSQTGDGLSEAPYAKEMYNRLAIATGGEVRDDGMVWVPISGLEDWLENKINLPAKG